MTKAKVTFPSAPDTSAIDIKDEGSLIVSNPTAMNFTGPGVTVTENPTGTAEVDIPGLQYWTESEDATTQQSTIFTPNNAATNVNAVLLPKGTGANTAQSPDGTTTGGNARGAYATDWQKFRTNANQVASGTYSTILNGQNNRADGNFAIAGGQQNRAAGTWTTALGYQSTALGASSFAATSSALSSGSYAVALGISCVGSGIASFATNQENTASGENSFVHGINGSASLYNQRTHGASERNQRSDFILYSANPTLATGATTNLYLDGSSGLLIPPGNNRFWNVIVQWTAVVVSITGTATGVSAGDVITQCNLFCFKKVSGTSSIVGSVTTVATHNDASMATASLAYSAGASQELNALFTAPTFAGGGTLEMSVTANVQVSEVSY